MITDIFTFCRSAEVANDGGLNISGAFNHLATPTFPTPLLVLTIASRVISTIDEDGEYESEVQFLGPDGEVIFRYPGVFRASVQSTQGQTCNTLIFPIGGVKLWVPGNSDVLLNIGGQTIARTVLSVQLSEPAA